MANRKFPAEEQIEEITGNSLQSSRQAEAPTDIEHDETVRAVLKNDPKVVFWCLFFALSSIGWGFDAQVNGAMISVPQFRLTFGGLYRGQPVLPAGWQSAFNSISSVGQFFGGFLCAFVSDKIGRRRSLFIGLLWVIGGIFGEVFSHQRVAFLLSKFILGIGLGFYLTLGPLYASEIAPVSLRGIVTGGTNLGICIGQLLSNAAIKGFGGRNDRWAFRGPFALQWIFPAILLIGLPFAPESPWYFARKGDQARAGRSLEKLYGTDGHINLRLARINRTIEQEQEDAQHFSWIDCFRGSDRTRTVISVGVFACQQLSGIIFVLGYSTYFFELAGIRLEDAFDLGVGVTACGLVGTIIAWSLINNWGRRNLFITGMILMTIVLLLMGFLDLAQTGAARWVQASCTVVYALIYQATIGPLAFAILGETSTAALRAKTIGLATACQAVFGTLFNIVIAYMINPDQGNLKGKVGFIFGGLCLISTVWSWVYIPELKGRTFAEIDELFAKRVPPRKMGKSELQ